MKDQYSDKIIMVRPVTATFRLVAFAKNHGDKSWVQCPEFQDIPWGIMLPSFVLPNAITLQPSVVAGGGSEAGGVAAASGHPAALGLIHIYLL